MNGVVANVKLDRGFGFISVPGKPDLFFHMSQLRGGLVMDEQLTGRRVKFELADRKGREQATNITAA